MALSVGDLTDYAFVESVVRDLRPDTIIHYGEQPSAPYSMIDARHATYTQANNVVGNLNVLFAMRDVSPETPPRQARHDGRVRDPRHRHRGGLPDGRPQRPAAHLPLPEDARLDVPPVQGPRQPQHPFRLPDLGPAGDRPQPGRGVRVETDESALDPRLATSFHYDEVFGTALNRFCVQAAIGHPLTVYGKGGQTRGYLNIRDTVACVALAAANPADPGELRVFNQFTEQFSVLELAERVKQAGEHLGWTVSIEHTPNPRIEMEQHYYNAVHTGLLSLGLEPRLLNEELIDTMLQDQGPRGPDRPGHARPERPLGPGTSARAKSRLTRLTGRTAWHERSSSPVAPGSSGPTWRAPWPAAATVSASSTTCRSARPAT